MISAKTTVQTCAPSSASRLAVASRPAMAIPHRASSALLSSSRNLTVRSAVATSAGKKAPELPPIVSPSSGTPNWYACCASAEFFFNDVQNEALAEQLRELARYYEEQNREIDFFFVCEPAWLDKFPEAKRVGKPAVALVSTDKTWITFMKLRLDRVLKLDLGEMSMDEATKNGGEIPDFGDMKWVLNSTDDSRSSLIAHRAPRLDAHSRYALRLFARWRAPYTPYSKGWWNVFMRK